MHSKILISFLFIIVLIDLSGCGHKVEKRIYDEVVIESPLKAAWQGAGDPHAALHSTTAGAPMPMVTDPDLLKSAAGVPLTWKTPEGWREFPGSGFRLVTFKAGEGGEAVETSIVSLSGEAGGIEPNLLRWMNQINLKAPSDGLLDFLKNKEAYTPEYTKAGNTPIRLIDFTQLQKDLSPASPSIYANIIETPDATIFIKMTGSINAIARHKKEFQSLSSSIKFKE